MGEAMTISLGLIVRDDCDNLARLLREMRPHVDEIVVVDTGSLDNSPKVANDNGADCVLDASDLLDSDGFLTSFGAARQRGLDACTGEWYLWLDTDDTLIGRELLRTSVEFLEEKRRTTEKAVSCSLLYEYTWNADRTVCIQKFFRERIVYRTDGWTWKRPIHEYLNFIGDDDDYNTQALKVVHLSDGARGVKNDRNLRILERWLREGGEQEDPGALFYYLGDEHLARANWLMAADFFRRCASDDCFFLKKNRAVYRMNIALIKLGRYTDVYNFLKKHGVTDIHTAYQLITVMHYLCYPTAEIYELLLSTKDLPPIPDETPEIFHVFNRTLEFYTKRMR